jgi:hypothetical protein
MFIVNTETGEHIEVEVLEIQEQDYKRINKKRYFFDWSEEKGFHVYKLVMKGKDDILGLVSLDFKDNESCVEIRLLAAAKENVGKNKKFERITGILIGFAARKSILKYPQYPCISLVPKTQLRAYYMKKYYMKNGGHSLFVDGLNLIKLDMEYA